MFPIADGVHANVTVLTGSQDVLVIVLKNSGQKYHLKFRFGRINTYLTYLKFSEKKSGKIKYSCESKQTVTTLFSVQKVF